MDERTAADFWDGHYGRTPQIWSGKPNAALVQEATDLAPGKALDLGCGEGGDAIWLASRGWTVTAVDVSRTAIERAVLAADAAGVGARIDWQRHDLAESFPIGAYDLVSAQFLQSPIDFPAERILRAAADAVAPGGTLLIVSHARPPSWAPDHHPPGGFPDPVETARTLGLDDGSWDVIVCELRERVASSPAGETATIIDGVLRAGRQPSIADSRS